ncbi:hypothetical protein E2C01_063841 [Portunus trituberculatus]|uniref:Uncharacterized protein n=1 Tax=Portunus trituberculatus TaxID=210409 RepID=A0A5B7HES2_PORTR|nr:hypothetical protein [Portunus trituberculatus]
MKPSMVCRSPLYTVQCLYISKGALHGSVPCHHMDNEAHHPGWWHHQALPGHCRGGLHREGCLQGEVVAQQEPDKKGFGSICWHIDKGYIVKSASLYMCGCMFPSKHRCICGVKESLPAHTIGIGGEMAS